MPSKYTDDETIIERLRVGKRFMEKGIAERDRTASTRFLDGSEAAAALMEQFNLANEGVGQLPDALEEGNVNYLATNIQTKVASIAIADPDFYLQADDPNFAEIVRVYLKELWKSRRWQRVAKKALLKRSISGLGCIAYLWHPTQGPVLEHVRVSDLSVDPNVIDWKQIRWAGRRIKMPREDALEQWPQLEDLVGGAEFDLPMPTYDDWNADTGHNKQTIELWVYWDATTEAILYGSEVLDITDNLYGKVPLLFLEGDLAPESQFTLGDYDSATQLQTMLARLQSTINNQAENGGAILWYNPGMLSEKGKEAFANGRPQGAVETSGQPEESFGYVSGEPFQEVLMEAYRLAQQGLDSATGVSEYQRGVINQSVKFATEAALLANQSGSRGNQARKEFELFCDDIANAVLDMTRQFGPSLMEPGDENDMLLFEAINNVHSLCIIESSTSYTDPGYEMTKAIQMSQVLMPFVQMGVINPVALAVKFLRAFGEKDVQPYLNVPMSPAGPPAPGQVNPPGQAVPPSPAGGAPPPAGSPFGGQ